MSYNGKRHFGGKCLHLRSFLGRNPLTATPSGRALKYSTCRKAGDPEIKRSHRLPLITVPMSCLGRLIRYVPFRTRTAFCNATFRFRGHKTVNATKGRFCSQETKSARFGSGSNRTFRCNSLLCSVRTWFDDACRAGGECHKLLFDAGPDGAVLLGNARNIGAVLSDVKRSRSRMATGITWAGCCLRCGRLLRETARGVCSAT